jgi:hypothetical protein
MNINISKSAGWSFTIASLILLTMNGGLAWLIILIPASLVLGYGIMWIREDKNQLTSTLRRR